MDEDSKAFVRGMGWVLVIAGTTFASAVIGGTIGGPAVGAIAVGLTWVICGYLVVRGTR